MSTIHRACPICGKPFPMPRNIDKFNCPHCGGLIEKTGDFESFILKFFIGVVIFAIIAIIVG